MVGRHTRIIAAATIGALVAGGIAFAAIPNTANGQITACYGADKVLKVVDATCPAGTTKLTWQSKGIRYMGAWSSTKAFSPNDIATSAGSSYIAKLASTNKPVSNVSYWALIAAKGTNGAAGTPGAKGATGATGASGAQYGRTLVAATSIDTTDTVGQDTSTAIGVDGLPIISYYDITSANLKVAHCDNIACTTVTASTLDSTGNVGQYTSITIGNDGLPIISYFDATNIDLKVAHCDNTVCTTATASSIDTATAVGRGTSITIGTDGLAIISYTDDTNMDLKVAHCDNTACSTATTSSIDTTRHGGWAESITIGADGLAIISFRVVVAMGASDLKVAHCDNTACTTTTTSTIDTGGNVDFTSITIGTDGLAIISYYDGTNGHLKVAHVMHTAWAPHGWGR